MAYKLIVADGSPSVQKAVQLAFPSAEFEVSPVSDSRDLLELMGRERPDALILSLSLAGGGGYEAGRALAERDEFSQTALFLLRGVFEPLNEGGLGGLRYDGLVVKPFDSEGLARAVKEAVEKKKGPLSFPEEASLDEIAFEPPRTDPSLRGFPEAARAAVREEILAVERELEKRIRTRVLAVVKEWMEKRPEERGRT
jgi:DNA-binding response OmpR family regulator